MSKHSAGDSRPPPASALQFFASAPHDCSYLPERTAITVFADPDALMSMTQYSALAALGFRRSGAHVYRPHCPHCRACVAARLPVAQFTPNRIQRRTRRVLPEISVTTMAPEFREEQFELYRRYISTRHHGDGMDDMDPDKYLEFLNCDWAHTEFVEFRADQQLVAVAVMDVLTQGLSCVYTFFDPAMADKSLGRLVLLWQIQEAARRALPWLFLGYWIGGCRKMQYKQEYRPIELFLDGRWQNFDRKETMPFSLPTAT
ncbi:MAG: arginyltransferase [Gammaproteobacteria bacterium]|nr:arginyltransferase [Gammaproteobacteria bacterium]